MHFCGVKITKANVLSSCAVTLAPPSFICSGFRSGCVALSCIYSSTLPLCLFPLLSEGVLAWVQGPASVPEILL